MSVDQYRVSQINIILLRTVAAVAALLAVTVCLLPWLIHSNSQGVIYVAPNGSDWNSGTTAKSPLKHIQIAVDLAKPGDRVILLPGRYVERVHLRTNGTKQKPIILEAETGGTVTIDWKDEQLFAHRAEWKPEGNGIYSINTSYPIYRISHQGEMLFRLNWGSVEDLRKLILLPNAYSAFLYQNGRCYVWLSGRREPSKEKLTTHKRVPDPREWGEFRSSNVWIEADHIIVRGLNLEYGIGSSIRIWDGENISIEQCAFSGATYGVWASRGLKPAQNLTLNHCIYHNYPQYEWSIDWLPWNQIYAYYSASSLISANDDGTVVESCMAVHCGDGLQISSKDEPTIQIRVTENWISDCTDDAIEFDGPARNIMVSENIISDAHNSLGLSPVSKGPVLIENNLFLHPTPNQTTGALFKLLSSWKGSTIQNVTVKNNYFWGNWLCWWNETPVHNLVVQQNIFFIKKKHEQPWPPGVIEKENDYIVIQNRENSTHDLQAEIDHLNHDLNSSSRSSYFRELLQHRINEKPGPAWWSFNKQAPTQRLNHLRQELQQKP